MKPIAVILSLCLASCAGSRDAPRPIGPSPMERIQTNDIQPMDDDDGDGFPNADDKCPEASEPRTDPVRDGCPHFPDAGVGPLRSASDAGVK